VQHFLLSNTIDGNFRPYQANVILHIDQHGKRYQGDEHPNGNVIFQLNKGSAPMAGQIVLLFSYLSQTFVILHAFKPLTTSGFDFTVNLPQGAGYLSSMELEPDPIIILSEDIVTHFASISVDIPGLDRPLLHVLPL